MSDRPKMNWKLLEKSAGLKGTPVTRDAFTETVLRGVDVEILARYEQDPEFRRAVDNAVETKQLRPMNRETAGFLEALLWTQPEDDKGVVEHKEKTIYDFSDKFIAEVDLYLHGFIKYLEQEGVEYDLKPGFLGHNVLMSLNGSGAGFFDEPETEHLEAHLDKFCESSRNFEHICLMEDAEGKLDLAIVDEFIDAERAEVFKCVYRNFVYDVFYKAQLTIPAIGPHNTSRWESKQEALRWVDVQMDKLQKTHFQVFLVDNVGRRYLSHDTEVMERLMNEACD